MDSQINAGSMAVLGLSAPPIRLGVLSPLDDQVRRRTGMDVDTLLERARAKQREQYESPRAPLDQHTDAGEAPTTVAADDTLAPWQGPAPNYDAIAAWLDDARADLLSRGL